MKKGIVVLVLACASQFSYADHKVTNAYFSFEKNGSVSTYKSNSEQVEAFCNGANAQFKVKNFCDIKVITKRIEDQCEKLRRQFSDVLEKGLGPDAKIKSEEYKGSITSDSARSVEVKVDGINSDSSKKAKDALKEFVKITTGSGDTPQGKTEVKHEYKFEFECL